VKERFVDAASGAAVAPESHSVPVREVLLMRSHLGQEGARYETVASFPLGGPSGEKS
jgi:2'-5' RNA ligase